MSKTTDTGTRFILQALVCGKRFEDNIRYCSFPSSELHVGTTVMGTAYDYILYADVFFVLGFLLQLQIRYMYEDRRYLLWTHTVDTFERVHRLKCQRITAQPNSGSPEVELRFCPSCFILCKCWTGWPDLSFSLCPIMCMQKEARHLAWGQPQVTGTLEKKSYTECLKIPPQQLLITL